MYVCNTKMRSNARLTFFEEKITKSNRRKAYKKALKLTRDILNISINFFRFLY